MANTLTSAGIPDAVLILTFCTFAIGTGEFAIMGLLPDIADELAVTNSAAGWLVTGYVLGIAIDDPLTAPYHRKVFAIAATFTGITLVSIPIAGVAVALAVSDAVWIFEAMSAVNREIHEVAS